MLEFGRVAIEWTSDASGNASVATGGKVRGILRRVVFAPGTGGDQPDNLYDAVLNDEHSIDVLAAQGANLSNAAASSVCPGVPLKDGTTTSVAPMVVDSVLTLVISNGGNTKSGTVYLYVD